MTEKWESIAASLNAQLTVAKSAYGDIYFQLKTTQIERDAALEKLASFRFTDAKGTWVSGQELSQAQARVAQLEAALKLETLDHDSKCKCRTCGALDARQDILPMSEHLKSVDMFQARVAELEGALVEYGQHKSNCSRGRHCECGLNCVLEPLRSATHTGVYPREPLPPDILADALQDPHPDSINAKKARATAEPGDEK